MAFFSILFAIILSVAMGQEFNHTITLDPPEALLFYSYQEKVCKNEPTCNLTDIIPQSINNLKYRNCMCDSDCIQYGDCCLDSNYYEESEQTKNYKNYHCSRSEKIYMKVTCPTNYNNKDIKLKCEKSILPLDSEELTLIVPVINIEKRITYGNEYCAQCHGETNYYKWNLTAQCFPVKEQSKEIDNFKQNYPLADFQSDTAGVSVENSGKSDYGISDYPNLTENSSESSQFYDLSNLTEQATKFIKFDAISRTFYSLYNGNNFTCFYQKYLPEKFIKYTRDCQTAINECKSTADEIVVEKCQAYTSIVIDDYALYRNQHCAACNGITRELPSKAPDSSIFETFNKANEADLCTNPILKEKFCN